MFAFEIAHFRGSKSIEPRDILGGIYVASVEFQRFTLYWNDWRSFEDLAFEQCGVDSPRICYWLPAFDFRKVPRKGLYSPFDHKTRSPELNTVYSTAEEMARGYAAGASSDLPILTPEHVLIAMLRHSELEISQKLKGSGIDAQRVEAALKQAMPLR